MNQAVNHHDHPTNKPMLVIFWLYVMIPLVWGVINTLQRALLLFH
jgi:hypothetical protein